MCRFYWPHNLLDTTGIKSCALIPDVLEQMRPTPPHGELLIAADGWVITAISNGKCNGPGRN